MTGFDVVSLAIVFDEGTEFPPGYVHLDNILVRAGAGTKCWTGPSDNSSKNTGACPVAGSAPINPFADLAELVDPAVQLAALADALPEVPATSWTLYPNPL